MGDTLTSLLLGGGVIWAACPACRCERADYEGVGAHLPTCPNCGSSRDPELRSGRAGSAFLRRPHKPESPGSTPGPAILLGGGAVWLAGTVRHPLATATVPYALLLPASATPDSGKPVMPSANPRDG